MSDTPHRAARHLPPLDRFDVIIIGMMIALVVAIGGVVLAGDRVGVTIAEGGYAPQGSAVSGGSAIRVRFSDAMDAASVEERFTITPAVDGSFRWTGPRTLTFTPTRPLLPQTTYTVTIRAGAKAVKRGSTLQADFAWPFTVRPPRIVYLAPEDRLARNLYLTDPASGAVYQLTTTPDGVEDYAVSPNGGQIAYTQYNAGGTANIWLLDLRTTTSRQITNCVDAMCSAPAWKPDGTQLAYQRQDYNTGMQTGLGLPRVWMVDLDTLHTERLFADPQLRGQQPAWSPDGARLAVFDPNLPGLRIHDFDSGEDSTIIKQDDTMGVWSPDSDRLAYPILVRGLLGEMFYTHLELADFTDDTRTRLSGGENAPVDDSLGAWSPDGESLLITRRYLDEQRYTSGKQLYLLDVASGEAAPLVVDGSYNHAVPQWDPSGTQIVFQRYPLAATGARPEVWRYDLQTGSLSQITTNASRPAWVP